ncbi:MAG TPA: NAD(P)-binding domain-containing protein [Ignavibacteria bacterium]
MPKQKIGVLGSGIVAQVLAQGFIKHGYDVMVGTRVASKLAEWKSKNGDGAKIGSFEDAAKHGELLVLAVKGTAADKVLKLGGALNLTGKTVIDTTNPIKEEPPVDGVLKFFTNLEDSLMERLQKQVPDANFVKAFNSVGNAFMVNPDFGGIKPTMFICGNNENAKNQVKEILDKFGHETEDLGKATAARAIEPLCILWCIPGFIRNQWNHTFKLLRK